MRLTDVQVQRIRDSAAKYFGTDTRVWLFGSRTDPQRRGGDIDLYIEPKIQTADEIVDAKLRLLRELHAVLGEQKIDVIIRRDAFKGELPIHRIARETGIRLL